MFVVTSVYKWTFGEVYVDGDEQTLLSALVVQFPELINGKLPCEVCSKLWGLRYQFCVCRQLNDSRPKKSGQS